MELVEPEQPNLLCCNHCAGTGVLQWRKCFECGGLGVGYGKRTKFLYWNFPLTRYNLLLASYRRTFNKIRIITAGIIGSNFLIWFIFLLLQNDFYSKNVLSVGEQFWVRIPSTVRVLLWLGLLTFWYVHYRFIREGTIKGVVEKHSFANDSDTDSKTDIPQFSSWVTVKKIPSSRTVNVADCFTVEALNVVAEAYRLADELQHNIVTDIHLVYALLSCQRIANIFIRLGVLPQDLQKLLIKLSVQDAKILKHSSVEPTISNEFFQSLFSAYEKAFDLHQEYVSVTELIVSAVEQSTSLQELFYDQSVEKDTLLNVVEWVRIRERLQRKYQSLHHAAAHRSKQGMDRAMTAVATPFLNQYSEDVTMLAQFGRTDWCVARDKERQEIFRIIEGGQQNVLLVGEYGVGKKTLIDGLAESMVEEDVPDRIKDKRLVRLNISSLLAGTTPSGAVERLIRILNEITRAGNIILYINNIHELMGISAGEGAQSLDVGSSLADYITSSHFLTIATTTPEAYSQVISRTSIGQNFTQISIKEMDKNQAIQALESKMGFLEYKHQVFFSYSALAKAVDLSKKFLHETYLPGNALEVLTEAASLVRGKRGAHSLISAEDVSVVVAEKTHIPVTTISADESTKLLRLEEELHKRVIGQDEAVTLVANALRRARADVRSVNRPIANFLFLGPTGVGKTELAKTIAEVYFGGEEHMVRLDMSEYQDKTSIYRLLGAPGEKGRGVLTEAVRRNPFTLVLLDELEKADRDILNIFLQVMDDGRLTDSSGTTIDFTNVILIATSNAGTQYVIDQLRENTSIDLIKDRLLHGELKDYFRPEFLNRFDGIVLFKPLTQIDVERIVGLMLASIGKDLEKKGVILDVDKAALAFYAQIGFDPEFGARPLRRVVQEKVENKLAELVLSGSLHRRSIVHIDARGEFSVEEKA
jgi:ATP-dependent Clp protease ATP-binding subunit ClpC